MPGFEIPQKKISRTLKRQAKMDSRIPIPLHGATITFSVTVFSSTTTGYFCRHL